MEVKLGYKQTEVGIIPDDWNVVAFESITTTIGDGLHGTPVYSSNGYCPFINGNNLNDGKIVVTSDTKMVDHSEMIKHRKPLSGKSILMSINGTIGKLGLYAGEQIVLGKSAAYLNVKADTSRQFVYHSLQTQIVKRQFLDGMTGSTIGNLGLATIRQTQIPLPPNRVEQRAIAAALSDVDALVGGIDRLIAKKRDLKQAAMQQLLTGQTRLPGFSGAWETVSLTEIVTKTAGFWGLEKRDVARQNHVDVIRAGDISPDGKLTATATRYFSDSEFAKARCKLGDVVITGSGSVGKVWLCDGRADIAVSNFVRILRPISKRVDGQYLFQLLLSEATQRLMVEHIATGVMANLGSSFFTTEWLHLPPPAEQRGIAKVLSDMDAELAALEARRDKTRDLKQAMMQELLTGKTRLVKPEAARA
jgi:type I restriction enzyme S subunit